MPGNVIIGHRAVGAGEPCFIIGEIGSNHNRDKKQLKELIDMAAEAGVDALKFQTFKPGDFLPPGADYDYWEKYWFPTEWHAEFFEYIRSKNVIPFSTAWGVPWSKFLHELNVPVFKVASSELVDHPTLRYLAATGKPILMSTGMSTWEEITESVNLVKQTGNKNLILLHCISNYPTEPHEANLRFIQTLRDSFDLNAGFSDHTLGTACSVAAVALGAAVIERHITLSRKLDGPDHPFALEPEQLRRLVGDIREIDRALGDGRRSMTAREQEVRKAAQRKLCATRDLAAGTVLTEDMLELLAVGDGLYSREIPNVVGKKLTRAVKAHEKLTPDLLR